MDHDVVGIEVSDRPITSRERFVAMLPAKATLARAFRFGVQAVFSFVASLAIPYLLVEIAGLAAEIAVAVTFIIVMILNFSVCRYYVFAPPKHPLVAQAMAFAASSAGFRAAEYLVFLLSHSIFGFPYMPVLAVILGGSFIAKFFFYSKRVF